VLESAQAVFTRLLDGVDPTLTQEIHHAVEQVNGVTVRQVRSRWLGHQLQVHLQLAVAANLSIAEAQISIQSVREQLKQHLPYLREAIVELEPRSGA
jgi:divalent metal cation (Fe/Co/Zn/Cd) transporter